MMTIMMMMMNYLVLCSYRYIYVHVDIFMFITKYLCSCWYIYVHIDIFKKFKYFVIRYLIKASFLIISASTTHYTRICMYNTVYRTGMYNRLLEEEPSGSKHVELT